ncbi:MAG: RNA polymerase sigma factor [Planctomycetota bacterium]
MQSLAELVAAARAGGAAERAALVQRVQPHVAAQVHRQLQRRLRPQQHGAMAAMSTGDVVQDVLLEVVRGIDRWEVEGDEPFLALLSTLVEHRLLDRVRHSQSARRDVRRHGDQGPRTAGAAAAGAGPLTRTAQQEQVAIYRSVLDTFADRERALLALRFEEQCAFDELARRLAYPSADAARKAFHAAEALLLLRLRARGVSAPGATRIPEAGP